MSAFVFCVLVPLLWKFPHPSGNHDLDVAFGPQGPWCAAKNLVALTVSFYGPSIILSTANLYCAVRILIVVTRTTKKQPIMHSPTNGTAPGGKEESERRAQWVSSAQKPTPNHPRKKSPHPHLQTHTANNKSAPCAAAA